MKAVVRRRWIWIGGALLCARLALPSVSLAAGPYGGTIMVADQGQYDTLRTASYLPGARILLNRGTTFAGRFFPQGPGTADQPITLGAYGTGPSPVIEGNTGTEQTGGAVVLSGVGYWTVRDLELTNQNGKSGVLVMASGVEVSGIRLTNLYVHNVNGSVSGRTGGGITLDPGTGKFDDLVVDSCTVRDIAFIGVQLGTQQGETGPRSTGVVVRNTRVSRCGHDGIILRSCRKALIEGAVVCTTGTSRARCTAGLWIKYNDSTVIQNCESYANVDNGCDGQGFDFDIDVSYSIIQYCYSHDNEGGFVMWCPGQGSTNRGNIARYNISQNDGRAAIRFRCGPSTNPQVYNNTFYASSTAPVNGVVLVDGSVSGGRVFNNIFEIHKTVGNGFSTGGLAYDHNSFYGGISAVGAGALTVDPQLGAAGSGSEGINTLDGYRLRDGSPCVDAGVAAADNGGTDFWGNTLYNDLPDIGANEIPPDVSRGSRPHPRSPSSGIVFIAAPNSALVIHSREPMATVRLYDVSGRMVREMHPGGAHVCALAPVRCPGAVRLVEVITAGGRRESRVIL